MGENKDDRHTFTKVTIRVSHKPFEWHKLKIENEHWIELFLPETNIGVDVKSSDILKKTNKPKLQLYVGM